MTILSQCTKFEMFRIKNNLKKTEIAKFLGVSNAFISQLCQGVRDIPNDKVALIKANKIWDVSMFDGNNITDDADESFSIPLIPIDAVAGFNGLDYPGVSIEECKKYCIPDFYAAGAEYLVRVSGSSMYPKYSSGDILACRKIPEITFFQGGKIYVIDSIQGAMVKRIYEDPNDQDVVICRSDNEKYSDFRLPKTEIRSLSIVVGVIRLE